MAQEPKITKRKYTIITIPQFGLFEVQIKFILFFKHVISA